MVKIGISLTLSLNWWVGGGGYVVVVGGDACTVIFMFGLFVVEFGF